MGCKIFKNNTFSFFQNPKQQRGQNITPTQVKKKKCQYTQSHHHKDSNTTFVTPSNKSIQPPLFAKELWTHQEPSPLWKPKSSL